MRLLRTLVLGPVLVVAVGPLVVAGAGQAPLAGGTAAPPQVVQAADWLADAGASLGLGR